MNPATPPFPEADLRALLAAAVAAWAADAGASAGDEPRRLYVDAFAGAELQFGAGVQRDAWEPTRAEAALRALDGACAGPAPRANALFVEEDPAHLQRVYAELEDLAGERLRATRDYASLAAGEASLVEAPFAAVADEVARFAAGKRAFLWLAPATARALPWDTLRPLLALPDATLLIRFPHVDFEKQSRHAAPLADLPGFARRIVEGCSALLGDAKHAWLPAWRADARAGTEAALTGVLERFRAVLSAGAGNRSVHPIPLATPGGARTWCFLVTAEAAVPVAVNGPRSIPRPDPPATISTEDTAEQSKDPVSIESPELPSGEIEIPAPESTEPAPAPADPAPKPKRKTRKQSDPKPEKQPDPEPEKASKPKAKPEPDPQMEAEQEPSPGVVLDLFPDDVPVSPPASSARSGAPAKPRRAKLVADDGFFADPNEPSTEETRPPEG